MAALGDNRQIELENVLPLAALATDELLLDYALLVENKNTVCFYAHGCG